MIGDGARQVHGSDDRHAVGDDGFVRARELAVAATLGGQVDDHRARRHGGGHVARDEHRRRPARHHGGGDHDVALGDDAGHQLPLAPVEAFVLGAGVAAPVFGVGGFERQLDEPGPETLHLLPGGRPDVVPRDHAAELPRRRDRLEPRHAGAHDQHPGGGDGPGGGHEHREHPRQRGGREQGRLVAGDRRHGGQRIHALRPRDARHQLDGEGDGAGGGDLPDCFRGPERPDEADQDGLATQQGEVGAARLVVGSVAENLEDRVRGREDLGPGGDEPRALLDVRGVEVAGLEPGAGLDHHLATRLGERRDDRGHEGDAPLSGERLLHDADDHESRSVPGVVRVSIAAGGAGEV